jgi:hypothetical protein
MLIFIKKIFVRLALYLLPLVLFLLIMAAGSSLFSFDGVEKSFLYHLSYVLEKFALLVVLWIMGALILISFEYHYNRQKRNKSHNYQKPFK